MSEEVKTFEEKIRRLEAIVQALEKGDVQLADSLKMFQEGTALITSCTQELDQAEQEVRQIVRGPDGKLAAEPFETTEEV